MSDADIQSGMILRVLPGNPMKRLQSAIVAAGMDSNYPDAPIFIINHDDFSYFANLLYDNNLKLSRIKEDQHGNILYSIEFGSPIIIR